MSLGALVFTGLKWTAITRLSTQLLNWVITLVVIRLLTPADYGLLAIAMGIVTVLTMLNELGLESALVQRKELEPDLPGKVFGFVIATNLFFFSLLFIAAPYAASFYGEPILADIIRVLAINYLLWPLIVVPRAMLIRRMEFRNQGIVMFVATASGSLLTLALALNGNGVWSLVWGNIGETVVRLIGILIVAKYWCWPRLSFKGMRKIITFGATVTLNRAIWNLQMQGDSLILGKLLGKDPTGIYSVAKDLAWLPMRKISSIVNPVAFAGFSKAQSNPEDVKRYVIKATQIMAIVTFPIFWGISAVSKELVTVVLGERWLEVIWPLIILSPIVVLQMAGTVLGPAITGTGRPIINLYHRLIGLVCVMTGVVLGLRFGVVGASIGAASGYIVAFYFQALLSCRAIGLSLTGYLRQLLFPFTAASGMYLAVLLARDLTESLGIQSVLSLLVLIGVGAVTYPILLWVMDRDNCVESFNTLRRGLAS